MMNPKPWVKSPTPEQVSVVPAQGDGTGEQGSKGSGLLCALVSTSCRQGETSRRGLIDF